MGILFSLPKTFSCGLHSKMEQKYRQKLFSHLTTVQNQFQVTKEFGYVYEQNT